MTIEDFKTTWENYKLSILTQLKQTKNQKERAKLKALITEEKERTYMEYAELTFRKELGA